MAQKKEQQSLLFLINV
jgi:hypothetical protein